VVAVGGSWVASAQAIVAGDFSEITSRARAAAALRDEALATPLGKCSGCGSLISRDVQLVIRSTDQAPSA